MALFVWAYGLGAIQHAFKLDDARMDGLIQAGIVSTVITFMVGFGIWM